MINKTYDPSTEWVPVSSGQMPTPGYYQVTINHYRNQPPDKSQVIHLKYGQFGWQHSKECIIAWRNLPEPYKGELK